jgi:hypothetical protein
MAGDKTVVMSINAPDGWRCVDIFQRPDGSFGFDEFRRDVEDQRGWFPIGHFSAGTFTDQNSTLAAALKAVPWLSPVLPGSCLPQR